MFQVIKKGGDEMKTPSIRTILLSTIILLTTLIASLAIREVYIEGQKLLKIQSLKKASLINDKLFEAVEKYTMVRDVTNSMVYAVDEDTVNSLMPTVLETRKEADDIRQDYISLLKQYNFPDLDKKIIENEAAFVKLKMLRRQLQDAITNHEDKQKAILAEQWFQQGTYFIVQTQDMWMGFIKHFSDIDSAITLQMRFKHFLGIIMEYNGRERAIIGRLLVENSPITPEQQANLLTWHGSVEMGWARLNSLAIQSGLDVVIMPYLNDTESHYAALFGMIHDMFYIPGAKAVKKYPISLELWLELSSQTTDSLYDLKDASVKESRRYRNELEEKTNRSIIVNAIIMILSFALCFYSLWVVVFRVITPINYMVEELLKVVAGKTVTISKNVYNKDDEIGKLGKILIALQQSNKRYRALVEASAQIIWTWKPGEKGDLDALKIWWEKTTGQPKEEMLPSGWLKMVHPDDRERAGKAWENSSTKGKDFEVEYRLRAINGSYRYVYFRGVALKNEEGLVEEVVGTLNDVTARRQNEENLQRYTAELERSNKELDDFAYIASHDLKEPLRGIHNHSRFLLEDNENKLEKESIDRLGRLIYLSQRMERLVNDLLYFSRLGRQEFAIQSTDLNEVISDIESTIDLFIKERNAKITIPNSLPTITCDKTRVTEVFRNLITNAIKYNDKDIKNVEIGFIENYPSKDGTQINRVFYVKDDGNGIKSEFYEEVFRIFRRLHSPKSKEEEGTGVGLTFVKKIIERHGGKVWLESEFTKGTTFYFTLEGKKYDTAVNT